MSSFKVFSKFDYMFLSNILLVLINKIILFFKKETHVFQHRRAHGFEEVFIHSFNKYKRIEKRFSLHKNSRKNNNLFSLILLQHSRHALIFFF